MMITKQLNDDMYNQRTCQLTDSVKCQLKTTEYTTNKSKSRSLASNSTVYPQNTYICNTLDSQV